MSFIDKRRSFSAKKIHEIKALLGSAVEIAQRGKVCVYATGSFGRMEASEFSDLDAFIAGLTEGDKQTKQPSSESGEQKNDELTKLDEILIKADLIKAIRKLELPDFDGDGAYLKHYTNIELIQALGTQEDDSLNTFTARLLLLLESTPLIGEEIYENIIISVINSYWRDYEDHRDNFIPTFFVNDVLRLWRTFCVNYEARTSNSPEEKKIKRRVKNYKLKYSRLSTCFSPILCLLFEIKNHGSISPECMLRIVKKTPLQRLIWLSEELGGESGVLNLIQAYEGFLRETDVSKEELIAKFADDSRRRKLVEEANHFAHLMQIAATKIGSEGRLLGHLLV